MEKIVNIIKILLIFLVIVFMSNNVYAKAITVEQIVEAFNKSAIVDEYKNAGGSIKAMKKENKINVEVNLGETTENLEFLVEGNIISIEINKEENSAFVKSYVALNIIDIIGQLHGHQKGDVIKTINSGKAIDYTLEKEGYEEEFVSANNFKMKVDFTKKIPIIDFSSVYIEVSDLEDLKEYINGDGVTEKSKGNVWFHKSGYDGDYTVLVAEKNDLTENTYKSILSILEVMFDNDKVITYFKNNYASISSGDKEFKGFDIKVNPKDKTDFEEKMIPSGSGYEFVRIAIDKKLAISSSSEIGKVENSSLNKENTQSQLELNTLPRTGEETKGVLILLYIIISICSIVLFIILITNNKKKK